MTGGSAQHTGEEGLPFPTHPDTTAEMSLVPCKRCHHHFPWLFLAVCRHRRQSHLLQVPLDLPSWQWFWLVSSTPAVVLINHSSHLNFPCHKEAFCSKISDAFVAGEDVNQAIPAPLKGRHPLMSPNRGFQITSATHATAPRRCQVTR